MGTAPRTKTVPYPHWVPLTDTWDSLGITSLAFDPSDATGNTIFAGTGNVSSSYDSGAAIGLLKSTDGGATWEVVGGTDLGLRGLRITAIAFSTPRVLTPSAIVTDNVPAITATTPTAASQSSCRSKNRHHRGAAFVNDVFNAEHAEFAEVF